MLIKHFKFQSILLTSAFFFTGLFFYFWLRLDPSLHYVMQESGFQFTSRFLVEYISYPGGIVEGIASCLMQLFVYPAAGALIISALLFCLTLIGHLIVSLLIKTPSNNLLAFFPSAFCVMLHSNYDHLLSITIGYTVALLAFYGYSSAKLLRPLIRGAVFLIIGSLLYYCTAGNFLLYAVMCIVFESGYLRQYLPALFYLVGTILIPFFAQHFVFLVSLHDAYFSQLPFMKTGYSPAASPYLLYAFYPAAITIFAFARRFPINTFEQPGISRKINLLRASPVFAAGFLIAILTIASTTSFNRLNSSTLRTCLLCRERKWDNILDLAATSSLRNVYTSFAVGQALYFKGRLSTSLFNFPQSYGPYGLFLFFNDPFSNETHDPFLYAYRCDLFSKIGLFNNAEQWGYESISTSGETPWMLQLLARIHAIKGEIDAANTCLAILETMPFQKKWAFEFRKRLRCITTDSGLSNARISMPKNDYILQSIGQPFLDIERLFLQNPRNVMAREYLGASYLLNGNLRGIANLINYAVPDANGKLPPLYQEALLLFNALDTTAGKSFSYAGISDRTVYDFNDFNVIMENYSQDPVTKAKILTAKYGNTFWYYYLYALQGKLNR
jgi:hypothetical protein